MSTDELMCANGCEAQAAVRVQLPENRIKAVCESCAAEGGDEELLEAIGIVSDEGPVPVMLTRFECKALRLAAAFGTPNPPPPEIAHACRKLYNAERKTPTPDGERNYSKADMETVNIVADAMHDPALGLDRVVSVRAIVKALRKDGFADAANHLRDAAREAKQEALDA